MGGFRFFFQCSYMTLFFSNTATLKAYLLRDAVIQENSYSISVDLNGFCSKVQIEKGIIYILQPFQA